MVYSDVLTCLRPPQPTAPSWQSSASLGSVLCGFAVRMSSIFRGASAEQDSRFSDKAKKLLRTTKFPPNFDTKVDMKKVSLESLLPWITEQVTKLLGNDDDVVTGYIQVCPAPSSHLAHRARLRLAVPGLRRAGAVLEGLAQPSPFIPRPRLPSP